MFHTTFVQISEFDWQLTPQSVVRSGQISNSYLTIYFFLLPARMEKIKSETRIFRGSNYCLAIATWLAIDKHIQGHNCFCKTDGA